jgi:hypothetical protein
MHFYPTASNYHKRSTEYIPGISDQQLLVLYVAANYKLRRNRTGWWAVGYEGSDKYAPTHAPFAIKSLLKRGLLEGNSCGERAGLRSWYQASTQTPLLWISAKGRTLLVNYQLFEPGQKGETDGIDLGNCYGEPKPTGRV